MKILVLIESIDIDDSSATKGRVALIYNLIAAGYELKVWHYTRRDMTLPGVECHAIPERKWNALYVASRIQRYWQKHTQIYQPAWYIERALGFSIGVFNDVNSIRKAMRKPLGFEPDWVLTLSKGSSFRTHMAMNGLPEWQSKWLAYVHDPYPFHFYPKPYAKFENGYRFKEAFFREVSKKCRHALFPSLLLQHWMTDYFPDFAKKGIVVPHQISKEFIKKQPLPDYFNAGRFTLLHAGNLMGPRNPTGLAEAFGLFLDQNPEAKAKSQLLFIGASEFYSDFLTKKQREIPELFFSRGYVSFETVFELQQQVSINIILEAKSDCSPFLPGKFPHCIEANKPILILGPENSETKRLLGADYPYWSEIDDVPKIAGVIADLYKKWKTNPDVLYLDRPDLAEYMSAANLKKIMDALEP